MRQTLDQKLDAPHSGPERLSRKNNRPCVLAIAGLDPSGGAGLLADLRTFAAFGVHGLGLVSAETVQNSSRVEAVWPRPLRAWSRQLACLLEEFRPAATKLGLTGGKSQLRQIRQRTERGQLGLLVVDPVLVASRGQALTADDLPAHLRDLLPVTSLMTPNLPELQRLTGLPVDTPRRAILAARQLLDQGAGAVLVKGGHGRGATVVDRLVVADAVHEFTHPRLNLPRTHGTGCHLASAITALLARGLSLPEACSQAIAWTACALEQGFDFGPTGVRYLDDSIRPAAKPSRALPQTVAKKARAAAANRQQSLKRL